MKRIVICCDGTWNTSEQRHPTNVVKVRDASLRQLPDGTEQAVYYHDGVGTRSWINKLPGGIFGAGLWQNVQSAYKYLVEHYEVGDELFFFGFSRGAYTARSVVGMVRKCGILRKEEIGKIQEAYDLYRNRRIKPDDRHAQCYRLKYAVLANPSADTQRDIPPIKFIGVWDTVGSLGIPLGLLGRVFNRKHRFHDVSLSRIVANAYQALAIDEKRKPFKAAIWEQHPDATNQTLEQRWFAGVHTNVGGGNADARQSDRTLLWIMSKAKACGLAFHADYVRQRVLDDPGGDLADSLFHEIARHIPFNLLTYVRPIGEGVPVAEATYLGGLSREIVDPAVIDRNISDPSYRPTGLVSYFRKQPQTLIEAKEASRSVWP
jgi:uncharacterized protein (DUF2235 family)